MGSFTITRVKSIPDPWPGYERGWMKCNRHGKPYYHDYVPYSLSNPVMWLDCGCDPRREVTRIEQAEGLRLVCEAMEAKDD